MMSSSLDSAAALELQDSVWEELRRKERKLEGDLDVKLSSYACLARDGLDVLGIGFCHLVACTGVVVTLGTGRPPIVVLWGRHGRYPTSEQYSGELSKPSAYCAHALHTKALLFSKITTYLSEL